METVEVVVYIAVAVILGGMIIGLIAGWDAGSALRAFREAFEGEGTLEYEKVDLGGLAGRALTLWEACGMGSVWLNTTVHLTDNATVNRTTLFEEFKRSNVCMTIQSAAEGCGSHEDVEIGTIEGPAVIAMTCNVTTGKLVIG